MEHHAEFIKSLIEKGGPEPSDYKEIDSWLEEISEHIKNGSVTTQQASDFLLLLGDAATAQTLQGFVLTKPHGYAGDFEIIDRIYQKHTSPNPILNKWDKYFHTHAATEAVRNRVFYFSNQLRELITRSSLTAPASVLNLASGPGRDMLHFFKNHPDMAEKVRIDCIEQDSNAINFAKQLCSDHLDKIQFIQKNALKYHTIKKYDLIWSAGLFDYFDDRVFVFLLARIRKMLADGGRVVIGNFCTTNPSKAYMNLFQWHLHHRSPNTLRWLATQAGFSKQDIDICREPSGVNLFLHAKI